MSRRKKNEIWNIHPGEILRDEFLTPMGISVYELARRVHLTRSRVNDIVLGRRAVTADTALRLAQFFGTTAAFWMNLQTTYDLRKAGNLSAKELRNIEPAHEVVQTRAKQGMWNDTPRP
jgi:addiction module HigA family antidote